MEQQLGMFEQGVRLSRECVKRLEEIEKRVELLTTSSDGEPQASDLNETA